MSLWQTISHKSDCYKSTRAARHAVDGGWFSYELKVHADTPQDLVCTYWGSDGGNRVFDILVDGEKIATQKLAANKPGEFFDVNPGKRRSQRASRFKSYVRFSFGPEERGHATRQPLRQQEMLRHRGSGSRGSR